MYAAAAIIAATLVVTSCANPTTSTYKSGDVGQVIETTEGSVLSSRIVDIETDNTGYGALGGAGVGAATGALSIGSGSGSGLAAVVGGLLGAGVGYLAEQSVGGREGIEYVIRLNDGRVVTLVQNRDEEEEPVRDGAPVLVQFGTQYTRVIEQPAVFQEPPAGEWKNPDEPSHGQPGSGAPDQPPYGQPGAGGLEQPLSSDDVIEQVPPAAGGEGQSQ
jgi:outer membrane lipoprotein SlyB